MTTSELSFATPTSATSKKTWMLRIWLTDRPGSLGAVAVALGEAGVNLVGIEIVERNGPMAIDEIVVEAADGTEFGSAQHAVACLRAIEGVAVETCLAVDSPADYDPRLDAFEVAAQFANARFRAERNGVLMQAIARLMTPDWAVIIDRVTGRVARTSGTPPSAPWLSAVLSGLDHVGPNSQSDHLEPHPSTRPSDLAWASCGIAAAVVVGRAARPFGARERAMLDSLGRLCSAHRSDDGRIRQVAIPFIPIAN